ncbi:hypothetical protein AB0J80_29355 [Actinoplanes sp. NPDC049548]|uniref:hypothetical protein n=1 Tax=Actinoplanes sp. NPDC049548 TaxID=3155152 RepID=UPI003441285F
MSYDLAVWEGDRPANDIAAHAEFERLYEHYIESDTPVAPTPRIAAYVEALLARVPDLTVNEGRGPFLYFPVVWSRCEENSQWAAQLAKEHGLNCYDPQWDRLRTPFSEPWRFELTSARGRSFRDPDADLVRRVLVRLSTADYYAILTRADDWYVQVGFGEQAGTRPGWYALERRDGTPDQHFRAELSDLEEVVRAFVAFLEGDPTIAVRFPWQPYAV